jgi:hypothetical protein
MGTSNSKSFSKKAFKYIKADKSHKLRDLFKKKLYKLSYNDRCVFLQESHENINLIMFLIKKTKLLSYNYLLAFEYLIKNGISPKYYINHVDDDGNNIFHLLCNIL